MPTEPAPLTPSPGEPTPPAPGLTPVPAPPKTTGTSAEQSGILTVWVPYDAKVTVNGLETRSVGSRRQFVSYGLKPGLSYKYVVCAQAEVVREGENGKKEKKLETSTQEVMLTAGAIKAVAFGFNASPEEQLAATR